MRSVRVSYLSGERVLRSDTMGEEFFRSVPTNRPVRVGAKGRIDWAGICLEGLPPATERVRFEVETTRRRSRSGSRSLARIDVPVRAGPAPPTLRLPFRGLWRVSQGHGCTTNHRLGGYGAEFAWDFVAVDPATGNSVAGPYSGSRRNRDTFSFGREVLAPAAGTVVRAVDGVADNEGLRGYRGRTLVADLADPLWLFGNHVVLSLGEGGPYVLLGHLRLGSLRVKPGDAVREGDSLAEVGNSGSSVEPHLHLHVMDRADAADREVVGLPAVLREYLELWSQVRDGRRESVVRRVDAGNPPEGRLVAPASESRDDADAR